MMSLAVSAYSIGKGVETIKNAAQSRDVIRTQQGKAYLSAILDLSDKSIVSFVVGHSNNNELVFKTFDIAHQTYPDARPIFHSNRGYQYTSKIEEP